MHRQKSQEVKQNGKMTEWSSWEHQEALKGKVVMNLKLTSRIWRHSFPRSWKVQMKKQEIHQPQLYDHLPQMQFN